ncbi:hypothetical protein ACWEVD_01150 [Nocardia thailandica]
MSKNWAALRKDSPRRTPPANVRIRNRFVSRETPAASGSDRKLPARADRPPSTRLMSSQGSALRFAIAALAEAQLRTVPGSLPAPGPPLVSDRKQIGWSDLLALDANPTDPRGRSSFQTVEDLREGQIMRTAKKLHTEGFFVFDNGARPPSRSNRFRLLDEGGPPEHTHNDPYVTPKKGGNDYFWLPLTFIDNGWLFVLPESAIAMVLLAAHLHNPDSVNGFEVSGDARTRTYGISPDTYNRHQLLEDLGILHVIPDPRRASLHDDIPRDKRRSRPHQIRFFPEAFDADAVEVMLDVLES